jgi:hypothetical protein
MLLYVKNWQMFDPKLFTPDSALPACQDLSSPFSVFNTGSHTVLAVQNGVTGSLQEDVCNVYLPIQMNGLGLWFNFYPPYVPIPSVRIQLRYRVINKFGNVINVSFATSNAVKVP